MKKLLILVMLAAAFAPLLANAQWSAVRFDSTNNFRKVHAVTADDAFLLGTEAFAGNYFLLRTNDGGLTWDSIPLNTATDTFQFSQLHFIDVNTGFAGGQKNNGHQAVVKTTDSGNTWTDVTPEPSWQHAITAVFFVDATHGFAAAGDRWYTTVNGGLSWTSSDKDFRTSDIYFHDPNTGYAVGTSNIDSHGVILKTTDGGASWLTLFGTVHPNVFVNNYQILNVIDESVAFVHHENTNVLYRTQNSGVDWDTIVCDSVYQIVDFHFNDANNGYLLSALGQLFSTQDGGVSWTLDYTAEWGFYGPSVYFHSLSFAEGVGYVCGTTGLIKRYVPEVIDNVRSTQTSSGLLNVYPNPCYGMMNLVVATEDFDGECFLSIFNPLGQLVHEEKLKLNHQAVFTVTGLDLSAGIYNVTLRNDFKKETVALVIVE